MELTFDTCSIGHCWHTDVGGLKCCRCPQRRSDGLVVMCSNQAGIEVGILAMKFPGRVGHMFSPGGERGPWAELPNALDNDAWPAAKNKRPRNAAKHLRMLNWSLMSGIPPRFALVPDVVGDRDATLRDWDEWAPRMKAMGFRLGFAAQDGMSFGDVPDDECVVFLGGTTEWKDAAIGPWCARFPGRVHVGRVNGMPRLLASWRAGAVSVDGTGWFHKGRSSTSSQANELRKFLRETSSHALSAVA